MTNGTSFQRSNLKRKSKLNTNSSRKRAKVVSNANDLPWKTVGRSREADLGDSLDGILDLEEVDDVEVFYEETDAGKVVRFKVAENAAVDESAIDMQEYVHDISEEPPATAKIDISTPEEITFDSKSMLPNWHTFSLHTQLSRSLHSKQFLSPTPIQAKTLPLALQSRDIVGIAETGSGKTLAYGLPILHYLLTRTQPSSIRDSKTRRPLRALILAPTRELALQVSSHLNACLNPLGDVSIKKEDGDNSHLLSKSEKSEGKQKQKQTDKDTKEPIMTKAPPLVSVAAVVGGMSAQKQRRILSRGVDVLVATPGRLWDILQEDDELSEQIARLRFLVLDEADRMIETGHFAELDNILRLTLRPDKNDEIEPEPEAGDTTNASEGEEDTKAGITDEQMQTFVFSATLSKDLQQNLKKRKHARAAKGKPASTLDDLLLKLDFRDHTPAVIDLSPVGGVVATLKESKVECLSTDKDAYLYYFLLRYPGRTLVFLSSIDGIRRLLPLMDLLNIAAFPLHSQLEQRQRLKNLDRFKSNQNGILLATDVAARGLDIPAVDHVVHYQIPRTADTYVHRNGRTARAARRGFSLLLIAPDERRIVRALLGNLNRQEEEIAEMPVELYLVDKLKERIQLAREIDTAQHRVRKEKHERSWLKETAEAMEVELDSDFASDSGDEKAGGLSKHKRKAADAKVASKKAELKQLLAQPLVARGVSTRYITSGTRPIVDDMLAGQSNEAMVGVKKAEAGSDLMPPRKRPTKVKEQFEEWHGFSE